LDRKGVGESEQVLVAGDEESALVFGECQQVVVAGSAEWWAGVGGSAARMAPWRRRDTNSAASLALPPSPSPSLSRRVHRCRLPLEAAPSLWVSALGSSLFAGWEFACPRNRRRSIYGQE
jgi:hypothetical protein